MRDGRASSVSLGQAITCVAAVMFLVVAQWQGAAADQCGAPAQHPHDWQVAPQSELGLRTDTLCALIEKLDQTPAWNIHAVLVIRDGKLAFEHYRAGPDVSWGPSLEMTEHDEATLHDVRSVTKSVVSLLFGVALDQKLIGSTDEGVMSFFPELADLAKDKNGIRIRHLLEMSSGIAWNESVPYSDPSNSETRMNRSSEPYRYVLTQPLATEPGKVWNYSGGSTALVAEILQRQSKRPLSNYAREFLFEPLGIMDFRWSRTPGGAIAAASGLRLRPRDMAKIGQMVLDGGEWNGRRIVSEAWIKEATKAHLSADEYFYGYFWWVASSAIGPRKLDWFEAYGNGAQRIIIVPELALVAVITTGMYNSKTAFPATNEILDRFILPAALMH
jgi:CubicO group peptidase (beta-lactamase class C family)